MSLSLEQVINEKTIKNRYKLLSDYLKNNKPSDMEESEIVYFKHIFSKYYSPDDEHEKFLESEISDIKIALDSWKNKFFSICVDGVWYPCSIKRLAGSNRTTKLHLTRSLRQSIQEQINHFRSENKLDTNKKCPVTGNKLGSDAQVDHEIPFSVLADNWLKENNNVSFHYDLDMVNYILDEPFLESWQTYHLDNAILRWVSREGNKYAHKLYQPSENKDKKQVNVCKKEKVVKKVEKIKKKKVKRLVL